MGWNRNSNKYTRVSSRPLSRVVFPYRVVYGLALTASQMGSVYGKKKEGGRRRGNTGRWRKTMIWTGRTARRQSRCNNCRSWLASRVIEEITRAVDTIHHRAGTRVPVLFLRTFITRDMSRALFHTQPHSLSTAVLDTIGSGVSGTTYGSVQQKASEYVHRNTKAGVLRFAPRPLLIPTYTTKKSIMPFIVKCALFQHMRDRSMANVDI